MIFSLYSHDFGASIDEILHYVVDLILDPAVKRQAQEMISFGGVKVTYSDTLYWDTLQRYDIHIASAVDMVG
jgi:hypothetical protein